jgi:hypothetical protein
MSRSKTSKKAMSAQAPPKRVNSGAKELKPTLNGAGKAPEEAHQKGKGRNAKSPSKSNRISRLRAEETAKKNSQVADANGHSDLGSAHFKGQIGSVKIFDKPEKQVVPFDENSLKEVRRFAKMLAEAGVNGFAIEAIGCGKCLVNALPLAMGIVPQDKRAFTKKLLRECLGTRVFPVNSHPYFAANPDYPDEYLNTEVFRYLCPALGIKIKLFYLMAGTDQITMGGDSFSYFDFGTEDAVPVYLLLDDGGLHCSAIRASSNEEYLFVTNSMLTNIDSPIQLLRD